MTVINNRAQERDPRRLLPFGRHGWLFRTPGFTADEVRAALRTPPTDPRTRAIARCVGRIDAWLPREPHFSACPQHAWDHLPRIVGWYTRGDSLAAIGDRIGSLGEPWAVERALDLACANIAACLNRHPDSYGMPRDDRGLVLAQRGGRR